jgi:hypothetical protein
MPVPNFFHPGSRVKKIPGSAYKNLSIFTQKIVSKLSAYDPNPSRIQGSKRHQKGTRSRIRNTAKHFLKIQIRGSVILKYGSGSGRPIIYRSRTYLDISAVIGKNIFSNIIKNY